MSIILLHTHKPCKYPKNSENEYEAPKNIVLHDLNELAQQIQYLIDAIAQQRSILNVILKAAKEKLNTPQSTGVYFTNDEAFYNGNWNLEVQTSANEIKSRQKINKYIYFTGVIKECSEILEIYNKYSNQLHQYLYIVHRCYDHSNEYMRVRLHTYFHIIKSKLKKMLNNINANN